MVEKLIDWAVHNLLVVIILAIALAAFGLYSFLNVNVEAYPDPAPAIVEVIAQVPGASAEEVERQITIPLEVALAGMPGLDSTRSKSLFGLSHLRNQFHYGVPLITARQEVLNRLNSISLPNGVQPQISPTSPTGEIIRYTLSNPKDENGDGIYTLNDLKSQQDWNLRRAFRRVPRIADIGSYGGTTKRYEVMPDPARLRQYGITLDQLQGAIRASNSNVGGDYLVQGESIEAVRSLGLIGFGEDPMDRARTMPDARLAAGYLRQQEARRDHELRQVVLASTNNVPVRIGDIVEGGPLRPQSAPVEDGVVVGHQPRMGRVMISRPLLDKAGHEVLDEHGNRRWEDDDDVVQGIVLLRKGEDSLPALKDVDALIKKLNDGASGQMLPKVKIDPYYDRTELIHTTTDTVQENLLVGMALVSMVLLMFLSNVRSALIVALNVPLAVLFAFGMLYLRGRSANLLSIGAVDFGIIVDSSVIIVENIYRHLSSGKNADLPLPKRVLAASHEVQRSLLFSTAIMVCAFIPLFTMKGPEGQIFGPMAETYAFALGGALLLAVTLSPVLCVLLLKNMAPAQDNALVRWLKHSYLRQLERYIRFSWITLAGFTGLTVFTLSMLPLIGREFMPQLEEGNVYVRGTFPLNASLDEVTKRVEIARDVMKSFPEAKVVVAQIGRPDDGTDPTGFYNAEFFVPLNPQSQWPIPAGATHPRSKEELVEAMNGDLAKKLIGVDWNFSQNIRDNVLESLSGVKGENSVKIIGPDLNALEGMAEQVASALERVRGIKNVGVFHIMGQSNLTLPIDRDKCAHWNVTAQGVQNVIQTAVGGLACTQMIEGEKNFDVTLRWPEKLRDNTAAILDIPVDVGANIVETASGGTTGPSSTGTSQAMPSPTGAQILGSMNNLSNSPRRRLGDLVTPLGPNHTSDPNGSFVQPGASTIYREQGQRMIAVKFDVRGRDLASAVAEAQELTASIVKPPYHVDWSGEFEEMQDAEARLLFVIPVALVLIVVLLYINFHSAVDVLIVLSNVLVLCLGGIWALLLTNTNFSVSAAVGFISIFGVGIMDGLILVSSFHHLRLQGKPLEEAVLEAAGYRLRPVLMTMLTAIFGLLPAALSTRIGAQTQRPLAIVVIGGMLMAILLTRYLTPVLYVVFRKAMPSEAAARLAE
ncbi:MAG TPA: efflux RND transporter permease subunit [Pirellulales bacterium]|jgi:cobalt-zinc-cadmium resistance protein CzcA|nr:efflux RND transporter permease subunit [Pirellulales bacterium]